MTSSLGQERKFNPFRRQSEHGFKVKARLGKLAGEPQIAVSLKGNVARFHGQAFYAQIACGQRDFRPSPDMGELLDAQYGQAVS